MPNTREKLIELLREGIRADNEKKEAWILGGKVGEKPSVFENMADHLIANGVTVQEWISVKDRLPENRDDVLVCRTWWNETRNPQIGWYNDVAQEWQILDSDGYYPCGKVTHWMPLPQPPKGE